MVISTSGLLHEIGRNVGDMEICKCLLVLLGSAATSSGNFSRVDKDARHKAKGIRLRSATLPAMETCCSPFLDACPRIRGFGQGTAR